MKTSMPTMAFLRRVAFLRKASLAALSCRADSVISSRALGCVDRSLGCSVRRGCIDRFFGVFACVVEYVGFDYAGMFYDSCLCNAIFHRLEGRDLGGGFAVDCRRFGGFFE